MDSEELAKNMFILQGKMQNDAMRKVQELSQGEMAMLGYLTNGKEESSPTELSRVFDLSTARVANALNSLEKKGCVERIHSREDRRKVVVHATDKGKNKFLEMERQVKKDTIELVEYLGEEDATNYYRISERIYEFFDRKNDNEK